MNKRFLAALSLLAAPLMGMTAWQYEGSVYVDGLPRETKAEVHFLSTSKTGTRTANACGWLQWSSPPEPFTIDGVTIGLESTQERCQNGRVVVSQSNPIVIARGFVQNQRYTLTYTTAYPTSIRQTGNCGLLRLNASQYDLTQFAIITTTHAQQFAIASLPTAYPHECKTYKNGDVRLLIPEGQFAPGAAGVAFTPPAPTLTNPAPVAPPPVVSEPQIPDGAIACFVRRSSTADLYTRSNGPGGPLGIYDADDRWMGALDSAGRLLNIDISRAADFFTYGFADYDREIYYIYSSNSQPIIPDCL